MDSSFAELDSLVSLINSSVQQIKEEYTKLGQRFPSLDDVEEHPLDTAHFPAGLQTAVRCIQGSCAQLSTLVTSPPQALTLHGMSHYNSAALGVVTNAKIADHLKGHPDGVHVSKLAEASKIDQGKLARVLRFLATRHCFREVAPDVFANNRLSAMLLADSPMWALMGVCSDENLRAASAFYETLADPVTGPSPDSKHAPWSRAMGYDGNLWDFYQQVDPARGKRFGVSMVGFSSLSKFDSMLHGFPWKDLPQGTAVCDVGGGIGHIAMHFAKACPQIRVILQDLPPTVEQAKQFWKDTATDIVDQGRVSFVPIDFIKQSPVPEQDIYYLKHIIHDWADPDSITILSNVKKAMKPTSRLIIQEFVLQSAAPEKGEEASLITQAPVPLLPNYGEGKILHYYTDLAGLVNAKERTLQEFVALGKQCDLVLVKVWDCGESSALEFKKND
ncbi:unnamed protein product [Somion occarium]|uniref:S-adenosyl-L-methionine-dependent methyltransferase n=1 Tax=Somion occarium TaxID=3059160 RepID=A0ABP1DLU7_9APHY